jgi:RecB family exonuclease
MNLPEEEQSDIRHSSLVNSSCVSARSTRLLRVPDPFALQRAIALLSIGLSPDLIRDTAIVVPTTGAAEALRQTLERLCLVDRWQPSPAELQIAEGSWPVGNTILLPHIVTRDGLYRLLCMRLAESVSPLEALARTVLFAQAAAREKTRSGTPPFALRPGLVDEMRDFYDALVRTQRSVDDFDRLVGGTLESGAEMDRGARRLLEQTRFLAGVFRDYQHQLAQAGELDEHGARARLLVQAADRPLRRLIVAVADQSASPFGFWPADYDFVARLPGLERLEFVATESVLHAGYLPRLMEAMPDIEVQAAPTPPSPKPILRAPVGSERLHTISRDREDELASAALRVRAAQAASGRTDRPLGATVGLISQRPLPYLALARQVFGALGVSWQAVDSLPLAAEPYASAVDVAMTFVTTGFARAPGMTLLRLPQFAFHSAVGTRPTPAQIDAADRFLRAALFLGGADRLAELAEVCAARGDASAPALQALVSAASALAPLITEAAPSEQLETLARFLDRFDGMRTEEDEAGERQQRARAAVRSILRTLVAAFRRFGDPPRPFADTAALLRRTIEAHTFDPRVGPGLVHLVDAHAAPFARFDSVTLLGVVEDDWPERRGRNIFYPASLLRDLGWAPDADHRAAARAAFEDLLHLAADEVIVSTFALEEDALVRPSAFVEHLAHARLSIDRSLDADPAASSASAPLLLVTPAAGANPEGAEGWRALREARRQQAVGTAFQGQTAPVARQPYSVTAVDRYVQCPFKYFAMHVLRLEEEPDEKPGLTPLERGLFVHDVFREFFTRWQAEGHRAIGVGDLEEARAMFARVVEEMLPRVPESERAIERTRLEGSAVASGLGERLFRFEAGRPGRVVDRLVEFSLNGEYDLAPADEVGSAEDVGTTQDRIRLRGTADRIDILADGTLRVIDYKDGTASKARASLQLPIYSVCAEATLASQRGGKWDVAEAGYFAFGKEDPFVPVVTPAKRDDVLTDARASLAEAVRAIEQGVFSVAPLELHDCRFCGFAGVCRKDYIEDA